MVSEWKNSWKSLHLLYLWTVTDIYILIFFLMVFLQQLSLAICRNKLLLMQVDIIMHIFVLFRSVFFFIGNLRENCYWKITLRLIYRTSVVLSRITYQTEAQWHFWWMLCTCVLFFSWPISGSRYCALCLCIETFPLEESQGSFICDFCNANLFPLLGDWYFRWGPICLLVIKQRTRERVSAWRWLSHYSHPSSCL